METVEKIAKKYVKISLKISKFAVYGLFFFNLTSLGSALGTMNSTLPLADFGSRLMESINIKIDEEKFSKIVVVATAYSSTPDQTDDTPFITAAGTHVRDGIIAANFLDMYTKVKIPELYGEKVFVVEDRMNRRYTKANPPRIDIWMKNRPLAKHFGVKRVDIVVLN